jgi:hypothetical protein
MNSRSYKPNIMKVENIVFMQGHEANQAFDQCNESDTPEISIWLNYDKLLEYLQQWHYPGEHEINESLGAGSNDKVIYKDSYVLTVNESIGYCGLEYILEP